MVHGLFKDLPKFKDVRSSITRHATKKYPVLDIKSKREIAIHHSLTKQGLPGSNAEGFARYHVNAHGWPSIGYSYVIEPDGTIKFCNPINWRTYHVGNSNNISVGICLTGDFRYEEPTKEQKESLVLLVDRLKKEYDHIKKVRSHDEYPGYAWKKCCEFDYKKVLNDGITESVEQELGGTYKVQEGDTFWSIAKGRPFEVVDLEHANPKVDPRGLKIGQIINIPSDDNKATDTEKESADYHGNSIVKYLDSIGEDSSFKAREKLADKYKIKNYKGTAKQNLLLLSIIRDGKKVDSSVKNESNKVISTADKGKRVESIYRGNVNFYKQPSFKNPIGTFGYGMGWIVVEKLQVGKSEMFKVKNSRGDIYYITARKDLVKVIG